MQVEGTHIDELIYEIGLYLQFWAIARRRELPVPLATRSGSTSTCRLSDGRTTKAKGAQA